MKHGILVLIGTFITFGLLYPVASVRANITWTGDVAPDDPTAWTTSHSGYIGQTNFGTVTVSESSVLSASYCYVGYDGKGILTLQNGGNLTAARSLLVDSHETGSKVVFDNGSITAQTVFAAEADLEGTGTIETQGWCYDFDRVISEASDLQHQFVLDDLPGQNVTVDVDLSSGNGSMGAGYVGTSTLTVQNGVSLSSKGMYLGYQVDGAGTITLEGPGTSWTNDEHCFYVGLQGTGTLNVVNQASLTGNCSCIMGSKPGSTGTVNIDGPDSIWTNNGRLYIGECGNGTLTITNGGVVEEGSAWFGCDYGSTGVVTVDGAGSEWTPGELLIGTDCDGTGTLHITNAGMVHSGVCLLGAMAPDATGEVTVDGTGSTWINDWGLDIGFCGSGTLNITNGGAVNVGCNTQVAYFADKPGKIHLDNGTLTTGGLLCAVDDLSGTGTIDTHGLISDVDLVFDATHGFTQTINLQDRPDQDITIHLTVDSSSRMGAGYGGNGTLRITDGFVLESTSPAIGWLAGSEGKVSVDGAGSTWKTNAIYGQGDFLEFYVGYRGAGTLEITDGGLVSVKGSLVIDCGDTGNSFINMSTGGMLAVFGDMDSSLDAFLCYLVDGTDAIRYWDDWSSDWGDIKRATRGEDYTLEYRTEGDLAGYTLLTVGVAQLPGDLNGDGFVGGDDLDIIRSHWGQTVPAGELATGDPSGDGFVGGDDLDLIRSHWGDGIPPGLTFVPEPGSMTMLITALLFGLAGIAPRR